VKEFLRKIVRSIRFVKIALDVGLSKKINNNAG
jgi:hypothetical protein